MSVRVCVCVCVYVLCVVYFLISMCVFVPTQVPADAGEMALEMVKRIIGVE